MAPLSVVGPVEYSWLLFAALIGWAFCDETPGLGVILGGGLILLAGGLLARARAPG
jgi:drug/metabolite transporter (DMT)-like permease